MIEIKFNNRERKFLKIEKKKAYDIAHFLSLFSLSFQIFISQFIEQC